MQDISGWEKSVNSLSQDYVFEAEVFLSGSNSRLLSGELATLLSGRYIGMNVYPFSFTEYLGVWELSKNRDSFIEYLQDAFLLHTSTRYNISRKEILGGNFKIYPNDQAYHNYSFPTSAYGRGYALEGIVYMTLIRKGYEVNTGVLHNGEVDFVATAGRRILYVQVAYSVEDQSTAEREYGAMKGIRAFRGKNSGIPSPKG